MKNIHDKYFKMAKREGYLARSIYKLREMDRRAKLIKPGSRVLDIGSCPGSWLEYITERVGPEGVVCAVDIQVIHKKFKNLDVHFKKIDVRELEPDAFSDVAEKFDSVVSDMAPRTSGIKTTDQLRSLELCDAAWQYARQVLETGGHFVCKILEGPELPEWRNGLRDSFSEIRMMKPLASRDESMETYLVGLGFGLPQKPKKPRPPKPAKKKKK